MKKILKLMLFTGMIGFAVNSYAAGNEVLPAYNAKTLKAYNGQKGQKAYVALNGYVYDVSDIPQWKDGKHFKGMVAGTDLTPNIGKSPHGPGIIKQLGLQPVGTYK